MLTSTACGSLYANICALGDMLDHDIMRNIIDYCVTPHFQVWWRKAGIELEILTVTHKIVLLLLSLDHDGDFYTGTNLRKCAQENMIDYKYTIAGTIIIVREWGIEITSNLPRYVIMCGEAGRRSLARAFRQAHAIIDANNHGRYIGKAVGEYVPNPMSVPPPINLSVCCYVRMWEKLSIVITGMIMICRDLLSHSEGIDISDHMLICADKVLAIKNNEFKFNNNINLEISYNREDDDSFICDSTHMKFTINDGKKKYESNYIRALSMYQCVQSCQIITPV